MNCGNCLVKLFIIIIIIIIQFYKVRILRPSELEFSRRIHLYFGFLGVFFRLEGQDILSFIAAKPRPNEEDIAFTIRPLLDVVNYLHGQKIVHLDVRVR